MIALGLKRSDGRACSMGCCAGTYEKVGKSKGAGTRSRRKSARQHARHDVMKQMEVVAS